MKVKEIINKLAETTCAEREELIFLLKNITPGERELLRAAAQSAARQSFGNKIYIRGLIEFTNICKNDCYYCGIRRSNAKAVRYRLSREQILSCCKTGYSLGFRTFVLQGGEDGFYNDDLLFEIVREIKATYPERAVTLSLGERG